VKTDRRRAPGERASVEGRGEKGRNGKQEENKAIIERPLAANAAL